MPERPVAGLARALRSSSPAYRIGSTRRRRPAFVQGRKRASRRIDYNSSASPFALIGPALSAGQGNPRGRRDEDVRHNSAYPLAVSPDKNLGLAFPAPLAISNSAPVRPPVNAFRMRGYREGFADALGESSIGARMPKVEIDEKTRLPLIERSAAMMDGRSVC
jgi:hypothetical protein